MNASHEGGMGEVVEGSMWIIVLQGHSVKTWISRSMKVIC